jgi:zinc/manganese transport system ATP-binding protein
MNHDSPSGTPTISLRHASLKRDSRMLWKGLDLDIRPGEFVAVLGPNGAGKTSLLKTLLGILPTTSGTVQVLGNAPTRGNPHIGYIPQQKGFDPDMPIRGRDLVQLGVTGFQYGLASPRPLSNHRVDEAIDAVGASAYADMPIGLLSGGEQQRLRVAQALVGKPDLLLCDEPLLSLDVTSQQTVTRLIDNYRQRENASVVFVTHEINPILRYVDRILYLTAGKWAFDKPDAVLQSDVLSDLYGSQIEVIHVKDRIIVLGTEEATTHHGETV